MIPLDRDVVLWDSDLKGFALKVTPAGRRAYFLYYRTRSGQQRRPSIGLHGELPVEQARQIAKQWLAKLALGEDVGRDRFAARREETVAELADRYIKEYATVHKKPRSVATDRANIENHVLPLIGRLSVRDVRRADLERLHIAIKDGRTARTLSAKPRGQRIIRGGSGIANRILALVSKMFACAEAWELRETNPARGIRKFKEARRERFLDKEEIARLLIALDRADQVRSESPSATAAIRVMLFTGMRAGEVTSLRWQALDRRFGCLRLADSKVGARTIPLSSHALAAVDRLIPAGGGDFMFPGATASLNRPGFTGGHLV